MGSVDVHRTINTIWKIESAKVIARVARITRDIGLAEDFAHDALVQALEIWEKSGIPENPGGWLMTTAKRKAIDYLRRDKLSERKHKELGLINDSYYKCEYDDVDEHDIKDDLLRLLFITCDPILPPKSRVALTLRLLGGLTTEEIAKAYLTPTPTIAQRIVRAKRILREARISFVDYEESELKNRLSSVLEVLYLMFNEGYTATSGGEWFRPTLCQESLRLGRILAELVPKEPEVHGLVALMEIQSSRLKARVNPKGEPILLLDQNRALWDYLLIRRGLAAIERAEGLGVPLGPYSLQAKIAACHAVAPSGAETDWVRISALYDALAQLTPSPIIELNRAVALSMAFSPEVGLEIVDELQEEPTLKDYHLLPSVRGDLLFKLNRKQEAHVEFKRAASLTSNEREREMLLKRASECTT
ncbi:RNA polymerase sigma factor [Halobacillus massiliensis]|uniref:RNA polymerase sigma factor n=1 Tax=Halobacillus massiliensis TaxID=1926286 RepID=UPI0009E1916F|nr:RNA polymerase sigma factor [Halobacillus massiliensis]